MSYVFSRGCAGRAMGRAWQKLAWIWVWRRAGLASTETMLTVNAIRAIEIGRVPRLGQAPLVLIARRLALHPELIAPQDRPLAAVSSSPGFLRRFDKTAIQGRRTNARQSKREQADQARPNRQQPRLI